MSASKFSESSSILEEKKSDKGGEEGLFHGRDVS